MRLLLLAGLAAGLVVLFASAAHVRPAPYITVNSIGETFTRAEYHVRIRGQLERYGYEVICIHHLGSVAWPAEDDENGQRIVRTILAECNKISGGRQPLED